MVDRERRASLSLASECKIVVDEIGGRLQVEAAQANSAQTGQTQHRCQDCMQGIVDRWSHAPAQNSTASNGIRIRAVLPLGHVMATTTAQLKFAKQRAST